jgi:hypothetical protein
MEKFSSRLLLALVLPGLLGAAEQRHRVDSPAALREALRRAVPGDRIQLRDGVHQLTPRSRFAPAAPRNAPW